MSIEAPPLTLVPTDEALAAGMARSLGVLLDQVRGARDVLPHLAALENGLVARGLAALAAIPPAAVPRMYSQLVSLPVSPEDAPLLVLRARLSAQLEKQRSAEREARAAAKTPALPEFLSSFTGDDRLVVSEASHSSFLAALEAQRDAAVPVNAD